MLSRALILADPEQRQSLYSIFFLNLVSICFFASLLQLGSSVMLYISHSMHKVFGDYVLPANIFGSLDPLVVALMAPVFSILWKFMARRHRAPTVWTKVTIGLGLTVGAFLVLFFTALSDQRNFVDNVELIVLANFFLGAGEACLSPAILAALGRLAPVNLQGTVMGLWYFSIALAGYLSGRFAEIAAAAQRTSYLYTFGFIIMLNLIVVLMIYWISRSKFLGKQTIYIG
jgi:POT family proton-dependent oligopeptide transporter